MSRTADRTINLAIENCIAQGWLVCCIREDGEKTLTLTPKGKQKLQAETRRRLN